MERTELKKSDSAGLDNSISPDSSMWPVENLVGKWLFSSSSCLFLLIQIVPYCNLSVMI